MKDIASRAGVTTSAVSLVFRGKPGVSPATRRRIERLAQEMGYRSDPYVATLMNNRRKGKLPASSPVLAFASAYPTREGWRRHSETFVSYFEGARTRAEEKGYRLETFWLGKDGSAGKRASEILYARNISGVLVAPLPDNIHSLDLDWARFHAVALGFSLASPVINRVVSDHLQSAMIAIDRCHQLGYRRIGLLLTRGNNQRVDRRWLAAFLMAQDRLPEVERIKPLLVDEWDDILFRKWMNREQPDVLIAHTNDVLQDKLADLGLRVPNDIGLVALNMPSPDYPASGVFENPTRIGSRAADLLITGVESNERGLPGRPTTLLVDGVWLPGPTLHGDENSLARKEIIRAILKPSRRAPVSMRDIAKYAGVHPATVSLSLRDNPRIPARTKERIRIAADKLGYRRNEYLSELMQSKRRGRLPSRHPVLGFVTAFPTRDGWKKMSPLFHQYQIGARRRAEALGFELREIWLRNPAEGKEISEALHRDGMQGVLFAPLPSAGSTISWRWDLFCQVGFGFTLNEPRIHRVASDTYSSMHQAVRRCLDLGYRRLGFVLSADSNSRVQNRWVASFLVCQSETPDRILPRYYLAERLEENAVRAWFQRESPDVVLVPSPDRLEGWLKKWGCSVPGNLGLVSLNCADPDSHLTGIDQNGTLLGDRAVSVLVGLIERNEYGISRQPNTLLVEGTWVPGASVKSAPSGPLTRSKNKVGTVRS